MTDCTTYPATPDKPGSPGSVSFTPVIGWGTGARSADMIDGDVHVVFTMPVPVQCAACGLRRSDGAVGDPSAIDYALQFTSDAITGSPLAQPLEAGLLRALSTVGLFTDTYEIRRAGEIVTYWRTPAAGPSVLLYTSTNRSVGPLFVSGALYVSGDQIG